MLKLTWVAITLTIAQVTWSASSLAEEGPSESEADEISAEHSLQVGELFVELGQGVALADVEVRIDGEVVDVTPGLPLELSYGSHQVRVAHSGVVFGETLQIGEEPRSIHVGQVASDPTGTLRVHADGIHWRDLVVKLDGEVVDPTRPIERAHGQYTLTLEYDGKIFTQQIEISEHPRDVHVHRETKHGATPPEVAEVLVPDDPPEHQEMTRGEKAKAQAKKGTVLLAGGVAAAGLGVLGVWVATQGIEDGNSEAPKALVGSATLAIMGAGSAVWGAGLLITSPVRLVTGRQSYVSPWVGPTSVGVHGVF